MCVRVCLFKCSQGKQRRHTHTGHTHTHTRTHTHLCVSFAAYHVLLSCHLLYSSIFWDINVFCSVHSPFSDCAAAAATAIAAAAAADVDVDVSAERLTLRLRVCRVVSFFCVCFQFFINLLLDTFCVLSLRLPPSPSLSLRSSLLLFIYVFVTRLSVCCFLCFIQFSLI